MLGNLHLLAHLILEVNAYSIIPLFSPSEKKNYFGSQGALVQNELRLTEERAPQV